MCICLQPYDECRKLFGAHVRGGLPKPSGAALHADILQKTSIRLDLSLKACIHRLHHKACPHSPDWARSANPYFVKLVESFLESCISLDRFKSFLL